MYDGMSLYGCCVNLLFLRNDFCVSQRVLFMYYLMLTNTVLFFVKYL